MMDNDSTTIELLLVAAGGGGGSSTRPAVSKSAELPGGGIAPVGPGTSSPATDDFTPGHPPSTIGLYFTAALEHETYFIFLFKHQWQRAQATYM